jgi:DNA-binding LacI/PurR family transcriptional regulator
MRRATLSDIAERAGVSLAAASLALRGKPGVGDETRRRIVEIAEELSYRARPAGSRAGGIGLLVKSRPDDVVATNRFYGPVIAGVTAACAAAGFDVRLDALPVDEHFNPIGRPRLVDSGEVDGVLVLGAYLSAPAARILGRLPIVLVDGYGADPSTVVNVVSDNVGGAAAATARLVGLGHRRIALVGTSSDAFPSIVERRYGYGRAMAAARLEPRYIDGHHDHPDPCVQEAIASLGRRGGPTAFVAANDDVAIEILTQVRDRVPRELSLVGFDGIEAAKKIRPRLDTVSVDKLAMGGLAVSLLRHRIAHPEEPAFTAVQRTALVVRETTGPPPR